jgi:hypothetical protein
MSEKKDDWGMANPARYWYDYIDKPVQTKGDATMNKHKKDSPLREAIEWNNPVSDDSYKQLAAEVPTVASQDSVSNFSSHGTASDTEWRLSQAKKHVQDILDRINDESETKEISEPQSDLVNHPPHYVSHPSGVEAIQITRHYDFCVGNAIKYLWRAGLKKEHGLNDVDKEIEDLKKAVFYINDKISQLQNTKEA